MNAPDKPCKARPISNNHGTGVIINNNEPMIFKPSPK